MERILLSVIFSVATVFGGLTAAEVGGVATNAAPKAPTARFMGKRIGLEKEGGDLSPVLGRKSREKRENQRKEEVARPHSREDVFLRIGDETLLWGAVDDYIDKIFKVSPLSLPPQATAEEVARVLVLARRKAAENAGNEFLRNWILVEEARANGVVLTDGEIKAAMAKATRKVPVKFRKEIVASLNEPNSYFYRSQIGYLISKKYIDTVVEPSVTVSDEDIKAIAEKRLAEGKKAEAYNAQLRPKMERWLAEIKAGKRDFEQTAYDESDCGSSIDYGVWGVFERGNNNLLPPLREFIFRQNSTNDLSGVIETPYSYHIVKILKRMDTSDEIPNYDADDFGQSDDEDDDNGATSEGALSPRFVKVAHIMLEKEEVPEVLDDKKLRTMAIRKKRRERTLQLSLAALARAMESPNFTSDFRVTLRNKFNNTKKRQKK